MALLLLPHGGRTNVVLNAGASTAGGGGGSKLVLVGGARAGEDGRKFVTNDAPLFAQLLTAHAGVCV
jgi:hypothetical protein